MTQQRLQSLLLLGLFDQHVEVLTMTLALGTISRALRLVDHHLEHLARTDGLDAALA